VDNVTEWIIKIAFFFLIMWYLERQFNKLKKWIEELVGFVRHKEHANESGDDLKGFCEICGRRKSEDYAECPTCNRRFVEPGVSGQEWNKNVTRAITNK
jgi:hypothetical protein